MVQRSYFLFKNNNLELINEQFRVGFRNYIGYTYISNKVLCVGSVLVETINVIQFEMYQM